MSFATALVLLSERGTDALSRIYIGRITAIVLVMFALCPARFESRNLVAGWEAEVAPVVDSNL